MMWTGFIWVLTIQFSFNLINCLTEDNSQQGEDNEYESTYSIGTNINNLPAYTPLSQHIELGQDNIFNLKFSDARDNFETAFNISNDSSYLHLRDALTAAEIGLKFLEEGNFYNASIQFEEAFNNSNKPLFNSLKNAADEAKDGVDLMEEGLFSDAKMKFLIAKQELPVERLYWRIDYIDKTTYSYVSDSNVAFEMFSNCEDSAEVAATGLTKLQSCNFVDGFEKFYLASKSSKVPRIKNVVENEYLTLIHVSATEDVLKRSKFTLAAERLAEAVNKSITLSVKNALSDCRNAVDIAVKGLQFISEGDFLAASDSFQDAYKQINGDNAVTATNLAITFASFKQLGDIALSGHTLAKEGAFGEASSRFQYIYDRTSFPVFISSFALCKNAADSLNVGMFLFKQGMFDEACSQFIDVADSEFSCMNDVAKNLYEVSINSRDANTFIKTGNITQALGKFKYAYEISYLGNITEIIKNCKECLSIFLKGQEFVEELDFHKASNKFQEAYDMSNVNKVKFLLSEQRKRFATLCGLHK